MATTFTLDDIRAAAEKKYGSTDIVVGDQTVRLLNVLKLSKDRREGLAAMSGELEKDGVDEAEVFRKAIRLAAETEAGAQVLIDAAGDDLTVLAQIFETYMKGTELGEASASES